MAFAAIGLVVRVLAPLLVDKVSDPAVVVVDDRARHAIALLGGHLGGANSLARRLGELLGAEPVITTATDVHGIPGLDTLGWPVHGDVAGVTRAVLDGEPVCLQTDETWPLPALPQTVAVTSASGNELTGDDGSERPGAARYRIVVSDRLLLEQADTVVLRPPSLVVGVGASRGVRATEIVELVESALARAGLSRLSVRQLATVEAKAEEPGLVEATATLGLPLVVHRAVDLAGVLVPNPSTRVAAAVGTASVAEAACLLPDPDSAELLVPKSTVVTAGPPAMATSESSAVVTAGVPAMATSEPSAVVTAGVPAMATVAVARHRARGRLALVGIGPGARHLLTPRAVAELRAASLAVGLDQYLDQIRDLLRPGTRVLGSRMRQERQRVRQAVEAARQGHAVALVGSGDAGIYGMASPALEQSDSGFDVVTVPGITASLAASALLGAPLGHDHAVISLSDLHTPWPVIQTRVEAAARGDLVTVLYNPRSHGRDWQLEAALKELSAHRPAATPVGMVRQATRADESVTVTSLAEIDPGQVDMYTTVVVGSSHTRLVAGRMVTPRGYSWMPPTPPVACAAPRAAVEGSWRVGGSPTSRPARTGSCAPRSGSGSATSSCPR